MLLQMALFHSYLWLNRVPLHICIMSSLFIHNLSVTGHLGCFRFLAIVSSSTMNVGVHVYFQIMFFFRYMPPYSSPLCRRVPFFSVLSLVFIICRLFDGGCSNWCEVVAHYSFDLHFSCRMSFHMPFVHLCILFGEMSI